MKNIIDKAENEICDWLKERGYDIKMSYISNSIIVEISNKISEKDNEEFKKHFKNEIILKGVIYENNGNYYKYKCNHELLKNIKKEIRKLLEKKNKNISLITIYRKSLSIYIYEKLNDEEIEKITKRFKLELNEYSLDCNGEYNYIFDY